MKRVHRIPFSKHAFPRAVRAAAVVAQRWKPLTLTWRKSLRATERQARQPSNAIVRNVWSPRFQLQLNLAFGAAVSARAIGPAMFRPSPISRRRSQTRLTWVGATSRSPITSESRRLHSRLLTHVAAHERTVRSWVTVERRRTFSASTFSAERRKIFRSRALPSTVVRSSSPQRWAQGANRSIFSQASDTVHRLRHSHATFRSRVLQNTSSGGPAQLVFARGGTAPAPTVRRPELVWRTEPQAFAVDAIERSISAATSPVATFVTPPAAHFEPSRTAFEQAPTRALDPALMDRLAEDVMGRVERRIRIERERRGV